MLMLGLDLERDSSQEFNYPVGVSGSFGFIPNVKFFNKSMSESVIWPSGFTAYSTAVGAVILCVKSFSFQVNKE